MNRQIFSVQKRPGFRLNLPDIGFLVLLAMVSAICRAGFPDSSLFWIPLYLALSFFLFCNVFRIGNRLEPIWYVPFTLIAIYGVATMDLQTFWIGVLFILEPLKWGLIAFRIRKGPYVGIFYDRVNAISKNDQR
jgi:hypothetical protein